VPIFLGYLAVSFSFGIFAVKEGLSILEALFISMTNLTSAGQLAGVPIITGGGGLFEMGLTQNNLAKLLGVSPSRISEYLSGRSEPTLKVGREICRKLHVEANIVLGV
jgi:predicted branched-subunit amino acid permease